MVIDSCCSLVVVVFLWNNGIIRDMDVNMNSNDELWSDIPEVINFLVYDDFGFSGFCYRPIFDADKRRWVSADNENFDWLDMNGFSLEELLSLRSIPSDLAILQRPFSWDGQLILGEVIRLNKSNSLYTMQGFLTNEIVWLENNKTKAITMVNMERISSVDGIPAIGRLLQNKNSKKVGGFLSILPPEVYNTSCIDTDKAMDEVRSLCGSFVLSG